MWINNFHLEIICFYKNCKNRRVGPGATWTLFWAVPYRVRVWGPRKCPHPNRPIWLAFLVYSLVSLFCLNKITIKYKIKKKLFFILFLDQSPMAITHLGLFSRTVTVNPPPALRQVGGVGSVWLDSVQFGLIWFGSDRKQCHATMGNTPRGAYDIDETVLGVMVIYKFS